ncbi:hypothetical protein ORU98_11915 [Pasteurella multocida]|uniref:hypothetical protein n=1 Tax=Pasteurella multocida TaxID=747 RepID=UPI00224F1372|nr:hypothetical protein [Pasteurella multocida]UZU43858.1 hypothetical protein ORU98_11915 [Pasteurella multocida]
MSKIGFNAQQVWDMSHAEINAWIESYLIQHGVKKKSLRSDETVTSYVFRRRKSQEKKGGRNAPFYFAFKQSLKEV